MSSSTKSAVAAPQASRLRSTLRQLALPREFRIPVPATGAPPSEASPCDGGPVGPDDPDRFWVDLGNVWFSLGLNLEDLKKDGVTGKPLRALERRLDAMKRTLSDEGVEVTDLTNRPYDARSLDFSPLGPKEPRPGLTQDTIVECKKALIIRRGEMLQPATGIVACPAGRTDGAAEAPPSSPDGEMR